MNLLKYCDYLRQKIQDSIDKCKCELEKNFENPEILLEFPSEKSHGDISTNVSMVCCRYFKMSPKEIAKKIIEKLGNLEYVKKCEIAGAGFINFFLDNKFFEEVLREIDFDPENYGNLESKNKKILVEFVSSNPTGPMHVGNARLGALGDSLSEILKCSGFDVCKEFYVNDSGNQIKKFSESLASRYLQIFNPNENFPEDGYHGDDIKELAKKFCEINGDKYLNCNKETLEKEILDYSLPLNIERMKLNLSNYKVNYDNWFYESSLYSSGEIEDTINNLKQKGATYTKNDALWFKATDFGSEKDEVLVRNNGIPTYFAADIAYHLNKFLKRKFDICVNFLGADHHGHVARMKSAMRCFGIDDSRLVFIIVQLVRLTKNGEILKMSKRSGKSETLEDFLKIVNIDSAKFIFNMQDPNSTMDFDIDLTVKNDSSNPSYYVKYAYARINSIIKKFGDKISVSNVNFELLNSEIEHEIIFELAKFPYEINESAKMMNSTKIIRYVINLASLFHKFYNLTKILCDKYELSTARCFLCLQIQRVIKRIFIMLKIDIPEYM